MQQVPDIIEKWGQDVAERGFAQIPNYLLLINQFISAEDRLTPVELICLVHLVGAWWKKDEYPFPSIKTLSLRCGVSERQMHRAIASLENKGLLKRDKKKTRGIITTNIYNLEPLTSVMKDVADVFENPFKRNISKERRAAARKKGKTLKLSDRQVNSA